MLFNAQNGVLSLNGATVDYISFGKGSRPLVMLPGLGDGLSTVKGAALPFALAYRAYAKSHRVYMFSRKQPLPSGCSTRDMARDQAEIMRALGLSKASVLGVSQGGMIAQYLAIDHPELVQKLVLAVTLARPNDTMRRAVEGWMELARAGDYQGLVTDTAEGSYSQRYLKTHRWLYPLLGAVGRPKSFDRFLIQAADSPFSERCST